MFHCQIRNYNKHILLKKKVSSEIKKKQSKIILKYFIFSSLEKLDFSLVPTKNIVDLPFSSVGVLRIGGKKVRRPTVTGSFRYRFRIFPTWRGKPFPTSAKNHVHEMNANRLKLGVPDTSALWLDSGGWNETKSGPDWPSGKFHMDRAQITTNHNK